MTASTEADAKAETTPHVGAAVKHGYVWNLLNFAVSQGASLAILLVLSRALTPSTFGVFALAAIIVDLFAEWGRWSATDAIVQRRDYSSSALSTAFFSLLGVGFLLTAIFSIAAPQIATLSNEPNLANILPPLAASLLIVPGSAVMDALVLRKLNFRAHAIRSMVSTLSGGMVGLAVAFSPAFEWALVAQRLTSSVVILLVLFALTRWLPTREFDRSFALEFLRRAFNLWIATVLATMHWRVLQAAVGVRSGAGSLGLLTIAQRFETALHGPLTGPIQSLWVPVLSALRGDPKECWKLFSRLSQLTALLTLPAFLGLGLVGRDIVAVALDERYRLVGDILFIVGLQGFTIPFGYFANLIFAGLDRSELSVKFSIIQLSVTAPIVWIAAASGPVWAFAAGLASMAVASFIVTWLQIRMLHGSLREYAKALAPAYLSALAMAAVVLTLKLMLPFEPGLARLLCLVAAGAITYVGWILIFHRQEIRKAWRLMSSLRSSSPSGSAT